MVLDTLSLTTLTGVIGATFFIVEILKRLFQNNTGFGKIPVFVYATLISIALVFVANHLIKDSSGNPILAGNIWQLMWRAGILAMSSGGFYSWLGATSIANAQPLGVTSVSKTPTLLIVTTLGAAMLLSGCADQTPAQKAMAADTLYNDTLTTLITLRNQGLISDSDYAKIEPIRSATFAAITAYELYEQSGTGVNNSSELNQDLDIFINSVIALKTKH